MNWLIKLPKKLILTIFVPIAAFLLWASLPEVYFWEAFKGLFKEIWYEEN